MAPQDRERRVEDLAGALLDGAQVDWAAAAADAGGRPLLAHLQLVAAIADACRQAHASTSAAPSSRHQYVPPAQWGHLQVGEPLGCGAFGQVYRAWDTRLDRDVALKLLPADGPTDAHASSIIEEGRLLARIRHPNVVTIYGADRLDGRIGLWMELVEGPTLAALVQQRGPLPVEEVVEIGVALGRAVAAVHGAGLLHRDIKAQNVIRGADGRVVLMDFGTGRDVRTGAGTALAGTPLYLAPELLAGGDPTVLSDVYSLGVLLYYLLTGSYPVRTATLEELRQAHADRASAPLHVNRSGMPPRLTRTIERAIAPAPDRRHGSAAELSDALATCASGRRRPWPMLTLVFALGLWATGAIGMRHDGAAVSGRDEGIRNEPAARPDAVPLPRSVAVLPFKPLVAADENEALQLGITEALIHELSRLGTLRVEPLARVRRFGALEQDPLEAGRHLEVDAVVEGHFRHTDNVLLVRWRLLRTDDGTAFDADEWEGHVDSMLHLQGRLVASLVQALGITPSAEERERIGRTETGNPEAFRHYLFGRAHLEARSVARAGEAEREFRAALTLDPAYARAHAALALTLTHQSWLGAHRGIDVMGPAKTAALRALSLDDSIALAHTALAAVNEAFEHDPIRAQAAHLRAMARDDQDLWVLRTYGMFLLSHDAFDEAIALNARTLAMDPTAPLSNRMHAQMHYAARRYDECVEISRRGLLLDPHDVSLILNWLPRCLEAQGRRRQAIEARTRSMAAHGEPARAERMMRLFAARGWDAYWREVLSEAGDKPLREALAYVRLGDRDAAIARLELLYDMRHPWLGFTNHPEWDSLRSDPRFQDLRARLGLTDAMNGRLARERATALGTTRR